MEVWRLLKKRYDPKTTLRNLQLWLKIMNPTKVKKAQDFQAQVYRWEGWINTLKKDYNRDVAATAKVGLLILMAPDDLQGTVLEHADRLRDYAQVKEKMVMLLDARGRLRDPNAMDVGYAGEEWWDDSMGEDDEQEVGALGKGEHCYRCGGVGHIGNECPTPKDKGKGREDKEYFAKGYSKGKAAQGEKGQFKGKGKGQCFPRGMCKSNGSILIFFFNLWKFECKFSW